MKRHIELDYTQLKSSCVPGDFDFATTAELEGLQGIVGQERAVRALDFGLAVKMSGYNIYMAGPTGTGKTTYAKSSAEKIAAAEEIPNDWCYVYNFKEPKKPVALTFKSGIGKCFKADVEELVGIFKKELQKAFNTEEYDNKKNALIYECDDKQVKLIEEMTDMAKEYGFQIKTTDSGVTVSPMLNGKVLKDKDYERLSEEQKLQIDSNTLVVQEKMGVYMREIKELDKESQKQMDELDYNVGLAAIGDYVKSVSDKYKDNEKAVEYLNAVQKDVLENIDEFVEDEEDDEESTSALLALFGKKQDKDVIGRYRVNLVVDNSETKGAPVIVTFNPTYNNLVGEVEYDNDFGNLTTDYMKIKAGFLHQANGGYLIVQAQDILSTPHAWEALRRVIKTKSIDMDSNKDSLSIVTAPTLKPEPIPADIKVIMIGNTYYYEMLQEYDDEFDKFFKIRADFDYEMDRNDENLLKLARYIKSFVDKEKTIEFDVSAVCVIIEYSSRMAQRQDKLTTRFNLIGEILVEAVTWAKLDDAQLVTGEYVKKAIYEKEERLKLYEEKLDAMFEENIIMIDTEGRKIGQINGLAVFDAGSYSFGNPSRITATTYIGKSGIVNIEKEARLSGQTHDKGVQIITGYLGQTYAQKFPLSLSCRVCFEQNYNGIDGDSASSTELYCILSSLSDLPIRQDLAVTGSVNQKGEIQAIGGVNYKIEGFFELCKKRGLTGEQGVLIPNSNVKDLVLNDEVIEAVKDGKFHIYSISNINEGLELLLSCKAGEKNEFGEFPKDSIHGRVMAKLRMFDEASKK